MSKENWVHVRLSAQVHPSAGGTPRPSCLHWRLEAKAPGEQWSTKATVGHGTVRRVAVPYPPSRDDVQALLVELLMGMHWTADGVTLD